MRIGKTISLLMTALLLSAASAQAAGSQTLTFGVAGPPPAKPLPKGEVPPPIAECVVRFGPAVPISAAAFSADGKTLAVGGYGEVLLWDLTVGKLAKRIGAGQINGRVGALAFVGETTQLAVGDGVPGKSGGVKLFETTAGVMMRTFGGPTDAVHTIAASPDGKLLAAGGAYNVAHVWQVADMKLVHTVGGHVGWVTGVAFSPDGTLLATSSVDKSVQIFNVADWTRKGRGSSPEPVHGVTFDPRGGSVAGAVGGPSEKSIRIWSTRYTRNSRPTKTGEGMPLAVQWPEKTNRLYAACSDGTVKTMGTWRGVPTSYEGHTDWVYTVVFNADGSHFASGSADGTVRLWNTSDGALVATLVQLVPRTDKWLVMTGAGYAATSSPDALTFKATGKTPLPEGFSKQLLDAESVRKVLAGEKVAAPALKPEVKEP